jgi:hypothetical protein
MLERHQAHTHATCGFCLRPNIIRSKPHEERASQPICPERLEDWARCFPQPTPAQMLLTLDK